MNFVLIPLQSYQPPAREAHSKTSQQASEDDAQDRRFPAATRDGHTQTSSSADSYKAGQYQMTAPRDVTKVSAEDREESKNFDTEQSQAEDVGCCR